MTGQHQNGWVIIVTIIIAFILSILPLPELAVLFRPDWVALVVIYWCLAVPERMGIGLSWLVGLLLDVLQGTLLGQHAFSFTLIAYVSLRFHLQIRVYPLAQQALIVLLLLILLRLPTLWVFGITNQSTIELEYWLPVFIGAFLWPWIFIILRDLRRTFKVR